MENNSPHKEELDLLDLAFLFWEQRLWLAMVTVAFFCAGLAFTSTQSSVYQGQLIIHPLDAGEFAGFHSWNQSVMVISKLGKPRLQASVETPEEKEVVFTHSGFDLTPLMITEDTLNNQFKSGFIRNQALRLALNKHSKTVQNFEGEDADFDELMTSLTANFVLAENKRGDLELTFKTSDKVESLQILSTAFEAISESTKQGLLQSIRSQLDAANLSREISLKNIDATVQSFELLYEVQKARSLAILREQASLARKLDLEFPFLGTPSDAGQSGIIYSDLQELDPFESNYFLQGYRAIEEQISNIQRRNDGEYINLIPELDELILERANLENQSIAKTLMPLLEASPLMDPDFRIVRADVENLVFEKISKPHLTILGFTVVGLLLSSLFVLARCTIQMRRNAARATGSA